MYMDILFFRCYDVFLIELLNEQHISIRNINGCYFLMVKEQTFLMIKLKLVRFALTTTSTAMLSVQLEMPSRPVLIVI